MDDFQVFEAREVVRHFAVGRLVLFGHGNTIPVVLNHKHHRQLFGRSTIDGLVNKAFGNSRLPVRGKCHTLVPRCFHRSGHPYGM